MWKSLSHSAQTLAALHYRFWCHTSPVLCMKQKIILKLGFNHFKIKFLLGNIINPCRTGWLFRMSSSYTFLFAETDRHGRFVRFPKFQPLTPTSSYNTLPTKIQNFTLIMGWQLLVCLVISVSASLNGDGIWEVVKFLGGGDASVILTKKIESKVLLLLVLGFEVRFVQV